MRPTPNSMTADDPAYRAWERGLRRRCRDARMACGLTMIEVEALGISGGTILAIESGTSQNVFLDQVLKMAGCYNVAFRGLVLGSEAQPHLEDPVLLHAHFRAALRRDRVRAGFGNDTLNRATGQNPTSRATTRMESGELNRIDLLRTYRVAHALGVPYTSWIRP